jgi:hypothetical protein
MSGGRGEESVRHISDMALKDRSSCDDWRLSEGCRFLVSGCDDAAVIGEVHADEAWSGRIQVKEKAWSIGFLRL